MIPDEVGLRQRPRVPGHQTISDSLLVAFYFLNLGSIATSYFPPLSSKKGDVTVSRSLSASFRHFSALEATEVDEIGSQKPRCTESKL